MKRLIKEITIFLSCLMFTSCLPSPATAEEQVLMDFNEGSGNQYYYQDNPKLNLEISMAMVQLIC